MTDESRKAQLDELAGRICALLNCGPNGAWAVGIDPRASVLDILALAWEAGAAWEREQAAKIAESFNNGDEAVMAFPSGIARSIRARGKDA